MKLSRALLAVGADDRPPSFDVFRETLDHRWVTQALAATGTATVRRRRLPADHAVWLVIGMALFRDRPIASVVEHLSLVLPSASGEPLTSGAIVRARDRLGPKPMECLFTTTSKEWAAASADAHRWRGLAVYGVDGSTLRVADTPDNEARFGRPASTRSKAGYPQLHLAALMVLRSHLLAGLAIGPLAQSEITLAKSLWPAIPAHSLTIVDRGFLTYAILHEIQSGGTDRHWLSRAKSTTSWRVLEERGPDDRLVELAISRDLRRKHPEFPAVLKARAITYCRKGFRSSTLLTSLLDPNAYPAAEIVKLYHERWELELGFDEIKTHTLEREESLRSRDPERTLQEVWGLAIAYNLVRRHIEQVAAHAALPPTRFSFRAVLLLMRDFWRSAWFMAPGTMPRQFDYLAQEMKCFILPPRRDRPSYPRAVKLKQSPYHRKR